MHTPCLREVILDSAWFEPVSSRMKKHRLVHKPQRVRDMAARGRICGYDNEPRVKSALCGTRARNCVEAHCFVDAAKRAGTFSQVRIVI